MNLPVRTCSFGARAGAGGGKLGSGPANRMSLPYSTTRSAFSDAAALPNNRTSCVGDPDGSDPPSPSSIEFESLPERVDPAKPDRFDMATSVPPFLATMVRACRRLGSKSPTSSTTCHRDSWLPPAHHESPPPPRRRKYDHGFHRHAAPLG